MTTYGNTKANQTNFPFILPQLPYDTSSFGEYISAETFSFHHGKHHNSYVNNLNKLLADKDLNKKDLEEIIVESQQTNQAGIFNNAAQIWNHSFYWHCLSPEGGGKPQGKLAEQIEKDFGSYENFAEKFKNTGLEQFGSGWVWLVYDGDKLSVTKTSNADLPMVHNQHALLTSDVWEHAYYLDYQNLRADYLGVFLNNLVNWHFAEENFVKLL